jgi:hypothetical protein
VIRPIVAVEPANEGLILYDFRDQKTILSDSASFSHEPKLEWGDVP